MYTFLRATFKMKPHIVHTEADLDDIDVDESFTAERDRRAAGVRRPMLSVFPADARRVVGLGARQPMVYGFRINSRQLLSVGMYSL